MNNHTHAQRGQATLETAIFLPVFMLVLFGVIWAVQSSVVGERAQMAVRFSGLVSDEADPYSQYSLGALYDGLPGIAPTEVYTCTQPDTEAFTNSGSFPGPTTIPLFRPGSTPVGVCTPGPTYLSGGSMTTPMLFVHTQSSVSATVTVPAFLRSALGSLQNLGATQNFFDGPNVQTILTCYSTLGTAVEQSIKHTTLDESSAATPLPDTPVETAMSISPSC